MPLKYPSASNVGAGFGVAVGAGVTPGFGVAVGAGTGVAVGAAAADAAGFGVGVGSSPQATTTIPRVNAITANSNILRTFFMDVRPP